jgi:truncated hemoglobin YjbI
MDGDWPSNSRSRRSNYRVDFLIQTTIDDKPSVSQLTASQSEKLDGVSKQAQALTEITERRQQTLQTNIEQRLVEMTADAATNAKALREEIIASLKAVADMLKNTVEQLAATQREWLTQFSMAVDASGLRQARASWLLPSFWRRGRERFTLHVRLALPPHLLSTALNSRLGQPHCSDIGTTASIV